MKILLSALSLVLLASCGPVPLRDLSVEEKKSDLQWVYSIFNENYAPLQYKESLHGFEFEKIKAQYSERAALTQSNSEFYDLLYKFVAEFKDAHTSGSLMNPSLPDRAKITYLGFSGVRKGDGLLVRDFLPTMKPENFPIAKGDIITKLNGVTLTDYITQNLLPLRNLGNKESNLSYHMSKIFIRLSTQNGQPSGVDAKLTVKRGDTEFEATLPWISKDLFQFQADQAQAKPSPTPTTSIDLDTVQMTDEQGAVIARIGFLGFDGLPTHLADLRKKLIRGMAGFHFYNGFQLVDSIDRLVTLPIKQAEVATKTPEEFVKGLRIVPAKAVFIAHAKTYPAYVTRAKLGESEVKQLVGVIYLHSFSPGPDDEETVKEFKATLASFEELGVKHIVIDMLNNGGGSLTLGMQLAQALSSKKIEMPYLQLKVSDNWIDEFQGNMLNGNSDSERELSRRTRTSLLEDRKAGLRLSRPMSTETLAPFLMKVNSDLKTEFKIVLAVNEMCASMCDIFSGILKDNSMAKIVGTNTMGAGGNVVEYYQSPNSHFTIRQTESLMLRKNGSYIENQGIAPDVEMAVNESADTKYDVVIKKAIQTVLAE